MADPSLLMVTGPPGAGKSTVAALLIDDGSMAGPTADESGGGVPGPTILVEGDAFFGFLAAGSIPPWLPESQPQNDVVVEAAAVATGRFVAAGWPTVFDGVMGAWYLDRFLATAGVDTVDYVVLLPSADRCVERIMTRVGHGFGDERAARHMHRQFTEADIDHRHLLTGDGLRPEETVAAILEARAAGALRHDRRPNSQ